MAKNYEIDMCNGPIFKKLVFFSVPLIISNLLQLLFNAADIIVVGQYAGQQSLAAVGSTTALINLLVNLFVGLSIGANVVTAQLFGEKNEKDVSLAVHTSITISIIGGFILAVVGAICSKTILILMDSPEDVINLSTLYLRIYFLGMPFTMLYNFGSSILRAIGDTRRPLYYLSIAGVINVILNLLFVIVFHLDVAGVALATIISQAISAFFVIRCLMKSTGCYRLDLKKLKIDQNKLNRIFRIGIPAGVQGIVFSISNILIQSSINSFGSVVMAGNTAASNIENFVYIAMNAFQMTVTCFIGQNYGAGKISRIPKILLQCAGMVIAVGLVLGGGALFFGQSLLSIYSPEQEVVNYGLIRMGILCVPYFLCGLMDLMAGAMRGLGFSVTPMIVSFIGSCVLRIVWVFTIFRVMHTLPSLYISYPITWGLTLTVHIICFLFVFHHLLQKQKKLQEL